ncbi:hypothetical protein ABT297_29680 [Dactylosporangium sp. NPDC000555]|uniref:hypothetical protein n=1 Tax=Dactylosporangium sp. NPDC000555 TaxID=3154260 RepID=UPI00332AC5F0
MSRLMTRAAALLVIAAAGAFAGPGNAQAHPVSGSAVAGVGQVTLDEPNTVGDRVWFAILAATAADGSSDGRFWFRHLSPDGTLRGEGWAEVTCLQVTGNVALFTAVVPEGVGVVKNHAFYMKITDRDAKPDQVSFIQAQNGSERPPTECIDFDVVFPGQPRYPVLTGGYTVHAG